MSSSKLDDLDQVSTDTDELFDDATSPEFNQVGFSDKDNSDGKESSGRILRLGLALVARIVRNMEGQLCLKSEEGKDLTFSSECLSIFRKRLIMKMKTWTTTLIHVTYAFAYDSTSNER